MIVATQPRRSLTVCLVAGAFVMPLSLLFHQVVNNGPHPTGDVVVHEESFESDFGNGSSPVDAEVTTSPRQLAINEASWIACGSGVADMCPFTHTWFPTNAVIPPDQRLAINEASWIACGSGVADMCPFSHSWAPLR